MKRAVFLCAGLLGAIAAPASVAETPTGAPADWPLPLKDDQPFWFALMDRFEYGESDTGSSWLWDGQGWWGGDFNKLWIKSEGEGPTHEFPEETQLQVLYSRLVAPFWNWQAGVRYDVRPGGAPDTAYGVLGLQGLAPQRFETDVALFYSDDGDVSVRGEFEYDLLFTQRLILQPRAEIEWHASDVPALGLGSGLARTEMGMRLRYHFTREVAPYLGVRWERLYGNTKDMARADGASSSVTSFVLGLRLWF